MKYWAIEQSWMVKLLLLKLSLLTLDLLMASGFGPSGGRSRCFPHWQETHKCFVMCDDPKECRPALDDYFECLHHNKEIARLETIKKEELKQIAERKKREENAKKSGVATEEVIQLNLISNDKQ